MIKRMDLGAVSAYALAVEKGYTGTEEEFAELLTNTLSYATQAQESASAAAGSAEVAGNYKAQAEAILGNVNLAGAQQIEAIEAAGTQQTNAAKEAIEAKGKETLDSIPDIGSYVENYLKENPATDSSVKEWARKEFGSGLIVTEDGRLSVDTVNTVEENNMKPITSDAVYKVIGNIETALAAI